MKYLFIELQIQDGERQHTHRILITTLAENVQFVAQRYAASYWGYGKREDKDNYWWVDGEITIKVVRVTELSEFMYRAMSDIFSGNVRTDLMPDDDGIPQEPTDPENFSDLEVEEFKEKWGQSHQDICFGLDLHPDDSDDILMMDYFWLEEQHQWYPKSSSIYTEREEAIADYLRHL